MFKYYNCLIKIEQSKDYVYDLLRSAFEEDKQLHSFAISYMVHKFTRIIGTYFLTKLHMREIQSI
jgi:hypothetical protein